MDLPQPLVLAATAVLSATISAAATVLVQRKPAVLSAEAQAQTAVNDGFAKLISSATDELKDARAEIKSLRGEIADLTQHLFSLETLLRAQGVPVPIRQRPQVMTVVPKNA